ncbi:FadR/GntR family transcriptional regulator [Chryseomicrobium aureum]|uniref:FadR/GntR family transcriptional regulator n=1 Tax=Chryseomicrobium aureum TaxID=1441723 RepID=UPI00370D6293
MNVQPVKKKNLSDHVVAQLKEMIVRRELEIGDKLPNERELCQMFDVSRTSVREALRVLELQGLLIRNTTGTYVQASFGGIIEESLTLQIILNSQNSYKDIHQTRLMLERELVTLATMNRSRENIMKLNGFTEVMENALSMKDRNLYIEADIAFHNEIALAANNSVMLFLHRTISELIIKVQRIVAIDDNAMKESLQFHKMILNAIETQNPNMAREALTNHLSDVDNRIKKIYKEDNYIREVLKNEKGNY